MTITVGLTVHKHPTIMLQAAASVLSQTYQDFVLLIGFNPEFDQSGSIYEVASHLCLMDSRVQIVSCLGARTAYTTWKELVSLAETPYYAHIDYDDIWLPEKLERQVKLLDEFDVVGTSCRYLGHTWDSQPPVKGVLYPEYFRLVNPIVHSSVVFNPLDSRFADPEFDGSPAWDYALWARLMLEGRRMFVHPDDLVLHRIWGEACHNTVDSRSDVQKIQGWFE